MSSMLALSHQPPDLKSFHHTGTGTQQHPGPRNLHVGGKSLENFLQCGLPTPPATAEMGEAALMNGHPSYRQQYPYVPDRRYHLPDSQSVQHLDFSNLDQTSVIRNGSQAQTAPVTMERPEEQIVAHLQIPESVNNSKGSLAEFAAEMTCLFWFETTTTLKYAEALPLDAPVNRGLTSGVEPTIGFRKWVTTILSTTQVGKNVILLAIMFIYRLKEFNPYVSGNMGSEFRLLTIALMLGNKFLDDNTYTNKTWAEVSGISVNEIHIMEVEFLSNMKYQLYASEEQWFEWKRKLGRFGSFYEKARRFVPSKTTSPTTPVIQTIPHKLPSPPSGSRYLASGYPSLPNPLHTLPQLPRSPARYNPQTENPMGRKRSLDTSVDIPPAKRVQSAYNMIPDISPRTYTPPDGLTPTSVVTPTSTATAFSSDHLPRFTQLPMPNLPSLNHRNGTPVSNLGISGSRAMSSVYPSNINNQQSIPPANNGPTNFPILPIPNGNNSRVPSVAGSAHTSPTNVYGSSTPTRQGLSPSYFLMNRSSPYRPVRNVNTLLYPPPLSTMTNPIKPIDYQQMHYQPIGSKGSEQLRSGPMPCLQPDAWQSHAPTPIHQIYRPH